MFSYTTAIVNSLLGSRQSLSPFVDLNIISIDVKNHTIYVSNNLVESDLNLYALHTKSNEQLKALKDLLEQDSKPLSHLLTNHYTFNGQYLEIVNNKQLMNIDIIVQKQKLVSKCSIC